MLTSETRTRPCLLKFDSGSENGPPAPPGYSGYLCPIIGSEEGACDGDMVGSTLFRLARRGKNHTGQTVRIAGRAENCDLDPAEPSLARCSSESRRRFLALMIVAAAPRWSRETTIVH